MSDFRVYLKPAGTNPEIEGPYYELSSFALIHGHHNFQPVTMGFKKGSEHKKLMFRPINPAKPIVLAIDNVSITGFVCLDQHLEKGATRGMRDYSMHKSDAFLIDCELGKAGCPAETYWSITSQGVTFVYGAVFPDTWQVRDCDLLCAFVAGEMTVNQLRMHAYLVNREVLKEERREVHIQRLANELRVAKGSADETYCMLQHAVGELRAAESRANEACSKLENAYIQYALLVNRLGRTMRGALPFVLKKQIRKAINNEDEPKVTQQDV